MKVKEEPLVEEKEDGFADLTMAEDTVNDELEEGELKMSGRLVIVEDAGLIEDEKV